MPLYPYRHHRPQVASDVFVAPNAAVVGDVVIGRGSSVWYSATIRGDVMPIRIGERTSIQDGSVVHATGGWQQTVVGDDVTVGHTVILHGCTIGSRVLVGMGSIVMDAAVIGDDVLIGAGSLVMARTEVPNGYLVHGRPAKVIRPLNEKELSQIREAAELYVRYGREHHLSINAPLI